MWPHGSPVACCLAPTHPSKQAPSSLTCPREPSSVLDPISPLFLPILPFQLFWSLSHHIRIGSDRCWWTLTSNWTSSRASNYSTYPAPPSSVFESQQYPHRSGGGAESLVCVLLEVADVTAVGRLFQQWLRGVAVACLLLGGIWEAYVGRMEMLRADWRLCDRVWASYWRWGTTSLVWCWGAASCGDRRTDAVGWRHPERADMDLGLTRGQSLVSWSAWHPSLLRARLTEERGFSRLSWLGNFSVIVLNLIIEAAMHLFRGRRLYRNSRSWDLSRKRPPSPSMPLNPTARVVRTAHWSPLCATTFVAHDAFNSQGLVGPLILFIGYELHPI